MKNKEANKTELHRGLKNWKIICLTVWKVSNRGVYMVISDLAPFVFCLYHSGAWCPAFKVIVLSIVLLECWLL